MRMQCLRQDGRVTAGSGRRIRRRLAADDTGATNSSAGTDWHLFPNHVFLRWRMRRSPIAPGRTATIRIPASSTSGHWSATRRGPNRALEREFIADWRTNTVDDFCIILAQDFQNFEQVQQGMKSRGFKGRERTRGRNQKSRTCIGPCADSSRVSLGRRPRDRGPTRRMTRPRNVRSPDGIGEPGQRRRRRR